MMSERYPDDAALLALEADDATGVAYIPTGKSPYYLEFRKLVHRLIRAAERANDLRVYPSDDLAIGVRPGRCYIAGGAVAFAGEEPIAVANNQTSAVWLDTAGQVRVDPSGLPSDRTTFVPLAEVVTAAGAITSITDWRGEAFLNVANLAMLGVASSAGAIDQVIDGVNPTVTAAALNALTGGPGSNADAAHRHEQMVTDADSETGFVLTNDNAGDDANVALRFYLSSKLANVTSLLPDPTSGWLRQRIAGDAYAVVGVLPIGYTHAGDVTASITGAVLGAVPCDGRIDAVVLSLGRNIESDQSGDGLAATVYVNGTTVTSTDPAITSAAGTGFRSTAQGDGTAGVVKSDGTEQVSRGDLLTVDITRTAAGSIADEAADLAVLVILKPNGPA